MLCRVSSARTCITLCIFSNKEPVAGKLFTVPHSVVFHELKSWKMSPYKFSMTLMKRLPSDIGFNNHFYMFDAVIYLTQQNMQFCVTH